jgi:hypothetical protein
VAIPRSKSRESRLVTESVGIQGTGASAGVPGVPGLPSLENSCKKPERPQIALVQVATWQRAFESGLAEG